VNEILEIEVVIDAYKKHNDILYIDPTNDIKLNRKRRAILFIKYEKLKNKIIEFTY